MRRHLPVALMLALPLGLLAVPAVKMPLPATWSSGFVTAHGGACVGPCCLITRGLFELSCGEYTSSPDPAAPSPGPPPGAMGRSAYTGWATGPGIAP